MGIAPTVAVDRPGVVGSVRWCWLEVIDVLLMYISQLIVSHCNAIDLQYTEVALVIVFLLVFGLRCTLAPTHILRRLSPLAIPLTTPKLHSRWRPIK